MTGRCATQLPARDASKNRATDPGQLGARRERIGEIWLLAPDDGCIDLRRHRLKDRQERDGIVYRRQSYHPIA